MSFDVFNLDARIAAGIAAEGYRSPTPIQSQAIPPVLAGCDVMGLAQTGTGKTAAFVLPALQRLLPGDRGRVRMLVIAPTRELAAQIDEVIKALGAKTGLQSLTLYGGVDIRPQIKKLRRGADIVVACPGRLLDHIKQGNINLRGVEILVLDEADQMFDMGFIPDVRRILKHLPSGRQTLLFAATMPADIRRLATEILHSPVTVSIAHDAPVETVSHAIYAVAAHLKTPLVVALLKQIRRESVLVFARTKQRAKRLARELSQAGYDTAALQGNLSQNKRQEAMQGFRDGRFQVLVATDIAARGIDVSSISHVINYDIPNTAETYTHRIGRTGRAAQSGEAFTLVTGEDEKMVRTIERLVGRRLDRRTLPGFDYSAPPRTGDGASLAGLRPMPRRGAGSARARSFRPWRRSAIGEQARRQSFPVENGTQSH